MFVSIFVLSAVWISINSNLQYYQTHFFLSINPIFIGLSIGYDLHVGRPSYHTIYFMHTLSMYNIYYALGKIIQYMFAFLAVMISAVSYLFSVQRVLQLLMSIVNIRYTIYTKYYCILWNHNIIQLFYYVLFTFYHELLLSLLFYLCNTHNIHSVFFNGKNGIHETTESCNKIKGLIYII